MPILDAIAPLRFGRFLLEPARRLLSVDNEPVQLSSRAFDILALLAENRHRIVSKDEIFANVWRGVAVEDNNLAVQMSALRRALAEPPGDPKIILTIPGRGYRFIAPVLEAEPAETPAPPPPAPLQAIPTPPEPAPAPTLKPSRRALWPALAAAVATLPILAWLVLPQFRQPAAPRLSIVVLPFRNLSADPQQDYLADAISDDLTTDLSHIPGSVVIARESADVYKGKAVGADIIGRALHVRYLLEGSLMPEDQILHVNAQLIDTSNGMHLWARRFDVPKGMLGRAQSEIVAQISSALNFTLTQVEAARSVQERPDNPDAVDLYLRARSVMTGNVTLSDLVNAQNLLEKAITKATNFSDAYAQLGIILLGKIGGFDDPTEREDYARAKIVVGSALSLSPNNPLALTASGMLEALNLHCSAAKAIFQKALTLDANQILAHKGLSGCASQLGDMQSMIDELQILRSLDPAAISDANRQSQIGRGYLMLGNPHEAIAWLDRAGAGAVERPGAETALGWQDWRRVFLIAAFWLDGKHSEASSLYKEYNRIWPRRSVWQFSSYETHASAVLPGTKAYLSALAAAGMPYFTSESEDYGVIPTKSPLASTDLTLTPVSIPGAKSISARDLHQLLSSSTTRKIIDFGRGAAVIPGSLWAWADNLWDDEETIIGRFVKANREKEIPVVVMGSGPFGGSSYNAALELVAQGFRNVLWFRGGEEAWVAAGFAAEDRRVP